MTKTTMTTKLGTTLMALVLSAGVGCKKDGAAGGATPGDKPAATGDKAAADSKAPPPADSKPGTPGGDPEKGDFTLEEATAGLAGQGTLMAKISTPKGDLHCELFFDVAPKTVASFVGLARGTRAWQDPKTGEWVKK